MKSKKETNHDIISFVTAVGEYVGPEAAKYIHLGLTSTDVKDTALGYMMKQACDILIDDLKRLHEVLRRRAAEFKYTPMIGPYPRHPRRTNYIRFEIGVVDGRGRT